RSRLAFVILAVAAGVAALTGVKGFSESTKYTLMKEARTLMGADLMIRLNAIPTAREEKVLESLRAKGIEFTRVTETVSMASAGPQTTPVLSSIKAADFSKYPFYGVLEFDPAQPDLSEDTVVVSDDLLLRMNLHPDDSI